MLQTKSPGIIYVDFLAEASISGRDKQLHPTEYCGMQLLIPAWVTWFRRHSLHILCSQVAYHYTKATMAYQMR